MRFRLPIVATLVTLIAFVTMLNLGFWQLDRAQQKHMRLLQIDQRQQLSPMSVEEVSRLTDKRDMPVQLSAAFAKPVLLLDNRINQGRVGYEVVGLVSTNSGLLLVNLGWVAAPALRQDLPKVALPKGVVELRGMVAVPSLNPMVQETANMDAQWPKVIQQIDMDKVANMLGTTELLDWVLLLSPEAQFGYVRDWQPVVMPPEKHQAYAMQWFGLAAASLMVYVFAVMRNRNKQIGEAL